MNEGPFIDMTYSGLRYTTSLGDYVVKQPNSLAYLGRHTFGSPQREQYTTYIDPGIAEALQRYKRGFDFEKFNDFSRSFYTLAGHVESLQNFASDYRVPKPNDPDWAATNNFCFDLFSSLPKVTSLDFLTELKHVPFEPDSAAGIGLPGKKGDGDNHIRAVKQASATVYTCTNQGIQHVIENSTPDRAFVRTQLTDLTKKTKIRHVFGQAFQYILLEGLVVHPLLQMFMSQRTPYFIGRDPRTDVPDVIERLADQGLDMFSTDWSSFDQTAEQWEIDDVFDLLESILIFPNDITKKAFEFCRVFFINRKIAGPDGTLWMKARGIPSGSYFTNLVGTWINFKRIQYLHKKLTGQFLYTSFTPDKTNWIHVLGDDALFGTFPTFGLNRYQFAMAIPEQLQHIWLLNPDKMTHSRSSDLVEFLQRTIRFGDQHRDNDKVERLAMYPEYPIEDRRISAFRARALWEDGNYESNFLGFCTAYLEKKYGTMTEEEAPRWVRTWVEKLRLPTTSIESPLVQQHSLDE